MKLSEKYFAKITTKGQGVDGIPYDPCSEEEIKTYGEICALEAQQTLLVSNPESFPQEKYLDKLSEIVIALQEISVKEGL